MEESPVLFPLYSSRTFCPGLDGQVSPTVVDEGEEKPCKEMHHRNEETELSLSLDLLQVFMLYSLYEQRMKFGREPQTRGEKEAMERREKRTRRTEVAETSKQVILDAAEAVLTRFSQIPLAFLRISFAVCSTNS